MAERDVERYHWTKEARLSSRRWAAHSLVPSFAIFHSSSISTFISNPFLVWNKERLVRPWIHCRLLSQVLYLSSHVSASVSSRRPRTIHGTLSANDQLELAAADLGALLVKLKARQPDIASAPGDHVEGKDDTFQNILNDAQKAAAELIERLH
jgi:hypothetical protein